ncbi:chaperone modulator CbpM [Ningiella sp. W23]|uniref:chaperone modulator CbpM n=1 Tax=Ningiella sp. W23 TaxID=3023715 RepID=UPI003757E3BE
MSKTKVDVHIAEIIDDKPLSLGQVCRSCGVNADQIMELMEYGVLEPTEARSNTVYFHGVCLHRVTRALRLKRDLGLNTAGAALVLELMDELEALRARAQRFEHLLNKP